MARITRRTFVGTAALGSVALIPFTAQAQTLSWSQRKKKVRILGRQMAYYEIGEGKPIVFLHGNPTSSYLWRNITPHVQHLGRCIAPDLIGMGDSDKLPNSGPGRYSFEEHQQHLYALFDKLNLGRCIAPDLIGMGDSDKLPNSGPGRYSFEEHQQYLYAMFDALNLGNAVTLVVHDWGSALGLRWAQMNSSRVRGIAYMEAIIEPPGSPTPAPAPGSPFAILRSPQGEHLILVENGFIEGLISGLDLYLTAEDAAEYRRPFLEPGESRRPTLTWPREFPLGGVPAKMYAIVRGYSDWLAADAAIPKLFVRADPGGILTRPEQLKFVRGFRKQTEVTVYGPHWVQEVSPTAIGRALAKWIPTIS